MGLGVLMNARWAAHVMEQAGSNKVLPTVHYAAQSVGPAAVSASIEPTDRGDLIASSSHTSLSSGAGATPPTGDDEEGHMNQQGAPLATLVDWTRKPIPAGRRVTQRRFDVAAEVQVLIRADTPICRSCRREWEQDYFLGVFAHGFGTAYRNQGCRCTPAAPRRLGTLLTAPVNPWQPTGNLTSSVRGKRPSGPRRLTGPDAISVSPGRLLIEWRDRRARPEPL